MAIKRTRKIKTEEFLEDAVLPLQRKPNKTPLEPQTEKQRKYMSAIRANQIIFGTGEAGSGKTYVATAMACQALESGEIDRIIITRPAQEAGESLGFLPGELEEKFAPYLRPLQDIFEERLGKTRYQYMLKIGRIEAIPLAYMRGMTLARAWVLADEAQNTTPKQMQMLLTRVGLDAKVIISGDTTQSDIAGVSGLADALQTIGSLKGVGHVDFDVEDVVRSGICREIVAAYARMRAP